MIKVFKLNILLAIITFSVLSISCAATQQFNQDVLANSRVKNKSFKKAIREIKKDLPKNSEHCAINITNIEVLKEEGEYSSEEWTVSYCENVKSYFVSTYHPKGYYFTIVDKKDVLKREIDLWSAAKKHGDEESWRGVLFYVDEIESMEK